MNDFSSKLKKEIQNIQVPKDKLNTAIEAGFKKGKRKSKRGHQFIYFSSAAVLMFGILVSSAFISPTMAEVVSKIPYLSLIFKSKSLDMIIWDKLNGKSYKVSSVGVSYTPKKSIQISLDGSDQYYDEVKNEVKKTVNEVLQSKGYDSYAIKITQQKDFKDYELNEEEKKEKGLLESEVTKTLKQLKYTFDSVFVDPTEKSIFINIVGSKDYYKDVTKDVQKVAFETAKTNHYPGYKIKVTRVTVEISKSDKGSLIVPVISEGLMSKKEFKVTGVGYKSKPLKIIIRTSIKSSNPLAKNLGEEIETEINEFLKSKDISSVLGDEKYEIIIYSKDKNKIN
ncbi:DUF4030 domain-containing protein [Gottfriedia sp. NPDC057991]|uniref:DUF4030 domain-containing protein n=1 Tax=Gottfriedia sp. NPDC057991 TaxID=3346298 RepID=UPI0036DDA986